MANESYSEQGINASVSNLEGYLDDIDNNFKLVNKSISSWSFDGQIPVSMQYVKAWDSEFGRFNIKPGQYVLLTEDENNPVARPIVKIYHDETKRFFNKTIYNSENESDYNPTIVITNVVGDGEEIVYTATNDLQAKDRVTIQGVSPIEYNLENVIVISANETSFTVQGSTTSTYISGGTAEIVASFTSDLFIDYLDENLIAQTVTFDASTDEFGYSDILVYLVYEDWEERNLGTDGWIISSSGNAIFNNLAVRGQINATSGNFDGFLTVNNQSMKIGANVNSAKLASIEEFEISSDKVVLTTTENHNFLVGETIIVENTDSIRAMAPAFPEENLIITGVSGDGEEITYTCANSLIPGSVVNILEVSPSSYNLEQVEIISATSTQFVVAGEIEDTYVSGGEVELSSIPYDPQDIDGTYVITDVTTNTISYDFVADNSGPFTVLAGLVSSGELNDGIYINDDNYWYSDGKLKFGGETNYVSWDNTTLDVVGTVTAESGTIGGWTLNSEEIFSDISDTGNTYRTGIKAPTGLGGGTYTPSIFYMIHDHDTAEAEPLWADLSTPFYVDSNGRFSLSDRFYYNQDIHNASGSTLSIVADAGKIGGSTASDARGWSIGPGFLYSGEGTNYVSLASPGANIPTTDTSISLNIEKIVVDAEGDNFSTIYIHVQSDDLLTILLEQTGYTLLELEDEITLSEAVTSTFSDKTMKFINLPGETDPPGRNLFDTEENLQLSSLANRFLSIRGADIYEVTLSSVDNFNASSEYSSTAYTYLEKKFVLEIYGEDYAYNTEKDEEIIPGVTYQSGGIDLYPINTTTRAYIDVSTASGLYVFWAGDPNPEVASISIDNNGFMSVEDITSTSIETGNLVLGGSSVVISDTEPDFPSAGDIWIDIS